MKLVLAMDLKGGFVVHGKSGQREEYRPLDWGCSPTAEPVGFVKAIAPKYLYIADLDRIGRTGSHDRVVRECARQVSGCFIDRGCRSPEDLLDGYHITNVIGTETAGSVLSLYDGGFLSLDLKAGRVIPSGCDPAGMLRQANSWKFSGCIILNIAAVGTGQGLDREILESLRSSYHGTLFWGGGVAAPDDLAMLCDAGFDGAIIATALHHGKIPLAWIRRGRVC
ncbi:MULTISPECIES: HisA/HisF-related TIM barrel protein [unclassified Methanoregula]|uniref:HisA/HisF-related TIM barrel protein n=1 Tax=unclassified Methanoregula TaxID=2649730 RepID=UPI0009C998FB|nr:MULTISPECIES: HisA/HisF-related TIM barrel protein [unclassified Methanoregula]OPX63665.1 MAG: 1-(5-phosphoribosyl)-5-((5-phosphoribosylamino)methylideneamino) imidazole-4-carboxamide isomerase [Methanoregula sp. PtaB.Bin085]OPY36168.1 MAG: 1-(5-phosphoribosyl)-5-((5-phosphoribosylamino)methylideneamino) imidazole-4-carboxamide isomerase [Methanoregula sp. PtaU1.Bin006]